MIYRLHTGLVCLPSGVDAGDFIVSGGTVQTPQRSKSVATLSVVIERYLASRANRIAQTYINSQRTHLGHLRRFLGNVPYELPFR